MRVIFLMLAIGTSAVSFAGESSKCFQLNPAYQGLTAACVATASTAGFVPSHRYQVAIGNVDDKGKLQAKLILEGRAADGSGNYPAPIPLFAPLAFGQVKRAPQASPDLLLILAANGGQLLAPTNVAYKLVTK